MIQRVFSFFRYSLERAKRDQLVLGDLGDGTHRARLDALVAGNAGILVHRIGNAVDNLKNLLLAGIDADAAADALISINNGT